MSGNSWAGKHKEELLAAAALTAVAVGTGGFGLLGAGAAGAAGAGAAEGAAAGLGAGFGADAAVGAGMGGSAASAFAPTAAQAAMAGIGSGGGLTAPFVTELPLEMTMAGAAPTSGLLGGTAAQGFGSSSVGGFGVIPQYAGMPELAMNGGGASPGLLSQMQGMYANANVGKGLDAFGKASKFAQMSGALNQPPQQAPARLQQGQQVQSQSPGVLSFMQMYGQPVVDPETLRRRQRMLAMQQGGFNG